MKIHLSELDIRILVLDMFKFRYDVVKDDSGNSVKVNTYDPSLEITWEGSKDEKKTD